MTSLIWKCAVAGIAAATCLGGAANARELKLGHVYETSHPMHKAADQAAKAFKECTGGAHTIAVYPSSQLGTENALNEQVRFGGVDIILTGQIFASSSYKPIAIGGAPFLFKDRDQALRYMRSDVFKELWEGWRKATGQHILSAGYFGAFNVTSNTPIEKPEDMKGLKIRVPDTPIYMAFPRALGANPTPIPLHEVYLALQQGVVTASANPLHMTYAGKFHEVQKFVNPTGHLIEYILWVTADSTLKGLSEKDRGCLQKSADEFAKDSTQDIVQQEDELRGRMESQGLIKFTKPDIPAFQAALSNAVDQLAQQLGVSKEIVTRIRAL